MLAEPGSPPSPALLQLDSCAGPVPYGALRACCPLCSTCCITGPFWIYSQDVITTHPLLLLKWLRTPNLTQFAACVLVFLLNIPAWPCIALAPRSPRASQSQ